MNSPLDSDILSSDSDILKEYEKENREPKRKYVSRIPVDVEVCSWDGLHSSAQEVLPDSKEYTYVVKTFRQLQCEECTGNEWSTRHTWTVIINVNP